jgi:Leucine-rich repeat (LRR) protein
MLGNINGIFDSGVLMKIEMLVAMGGMLLLILLSVRIHKKKIRPYGKADEALEEAKRRIKRLKDSDTELDLSGLTELQELPAIIRKNKQLIKVDLSGTSISDISVLSELAEIELLNIQNTHVKELYALQKNKKLRILMRNTPVAIRAERIRSEKLLAADVKKSNSQEAFIKAQHRLAVAGSSLTRVDLSDLSALEMLPSAEHIDPRLTHICLRGTNISDLSSLIGLSNLVSLDLSDAPVSTISPILSLDKLKVLNLSGTKITNIIGISRLKNLTDLHINRTVVADVEPILGMIHLRLIDVSDTLVLDMKPIWLLKDCIERTKHNFVIPFKYVYENTPADKEQTRRLDYEKTIEDSWRTRPEAAFKQAQKIIHSTGARSYGVTLKFLYALEQIPEEFSKFIELDKLDLSFTRIQSLDFLCNMKFLETGIYEINIERTLIGDLAPLARFSTLHTIQCESTPVASLNGIEQLKNLKKLVAHGTKIRDLVALSNSFRLEELFVGGCQITDLRPLRKIASLQQLHCWKNPIQSIEGIEGLRGLRELDLQGTNISNISGLASLTLLEQLNLENTQVSDISALSQLKNLKFLTLDGTLVESLAPLKELTNLVYLSVNNTAIKDYSEIESLIDTGLDAFGASSKPQKTDKKFLVALRM